MCVHLTEITLSLISVVWIRCFCPFCEWTLGSSLRSTGKKPIATDESSKEAASVTALEECAFVVQSEKFPFMQQFGITVLAESTKGYLGAHLKPEFYKRNNLQRQRRKQRSEKLPSDVSFRLTEMKPPLDFSSSERCFMSILQRDVWEPLEADGEKANIPGGKRKGKKLAENLLCDACTHLGELNLSF